MREVRPRPAVVTAQRDASEQRSPASVDRPTVNRNIQGLRALAVTLVVGYHLWGHRVPGGFVGVDVFFVVSGFLITSHLLAHPPTTVRDLAVFWSRRIRRLLPAATLVLTSTLVASRLLAPETEWARTADQVRSAVLYVVNWRLAADSVDYLASAAAPTPVQHFWSLSVEEQFYLAWPVLILGLVWLARSVRVRPDGPTIIGLGLVSAASFAYSVHETALDPAQAYFITPTRVWELGAGGVLAALLSPRAFGRGAESVSIRLPAPARAVLAWTGLAAIVASALLYGAGTPFPGYAAALPVLGTVAVIAAASDRGRGSPGSILAQRPVQWLGDVSYSVYLWHWPLIVLVPYATGVALRTGDKLAIIVATLVLAGLTKWLVEDPFRADWWARPLVRPYALGAAVMAVVLAGAWVQDVQVQHRQTVAKVALHQVLAKPPSCFGAAALAAGPGVCPVTTSGPLTPSPLAAANDKSDAYAGGPGGSDCESKEPSFPVVRCTFGDPAGTLDVALVGNSHAAEWLPALQAIAATQHWRITTLIASGCGLVDAPQSFPTHASTTACQVWARTVTAQIVSDGFDLVVLANRLDASPGLTLTASQPAYVASLRAELLAFSRAHVRVVGIRDTPIPGTVIPDCLAAHEQDYTVCEGTPATWLLPDPLTSAVADVHDPHIVEADLSDYLCTDTVCPAAIGGVPVYFDGSHITATYSRTLAPYLQPILVRALAD